MKVLLRLLAALVLLVWLASRMDLHALGAVVRQVSLLHLFFSFMTIHIAYVLLTLRWKILLDRSAVRVPFRDLLKLTYIAHFAGYLLPGGFSIDAVRGVYLWRGLSERRGEGVASILVDRLVGFWAILLLALVGAVGLGRQALILPLGAAFGGLTLAWILAFLPFSSDLVRRIAPRLWMGERILRLYEALRRYAHAPVRLLLAALISLAFQFAYVYAAHLVLQGLTDAPPALAASLAYVSLINALTMIPVTIGGLGIREGGFVAAFQGLPREVAFTGSLLYYGVSVFAALPGAVLWFLEKDRIQATVDEVS